MSNTFDDLREVGSNWFKHHGVKGMKWGVRKDRRSGSSGSDRKNSRALKRAIKKAGKTKVREIKRDNTFRSNPRNRRMTNDELRRSIERLDLERRFAQATGSDKKSGKQVIADILADSSKQIAKQVLVNVGSDYLARAARINLNKVVPPEYAVAVQNVINNELKKK